MIQVAVSPMAIGFRRIIQPAIWIVPRICIGWSTIHMPTRNNDMITSDHGKNAFRACRVRIV